MIKRVLGLTLAAFFTMGILGTSVFAFPGVHEAKPLDSKPGREVDLTTAAGEIDLPVLRVSGSEPGDTGTVSLNLKNAGSSAGSLTIQASVTNDGGSGSTEFEDGRGDLGNAAEMALFVDLNHNGTFDISDIGLKADGTTYIQPASQYSTVDSYANIIWLDIITMAEGAAGCIMLDWRIPAEADNRIQGDSATVQFVITLAPVEYKSKRLR